MNKGLCKKIAKKLPLGSFLDYVENGAYEDRARGISPRKLVAKITGHFLYSLAGGILAAGLIVLPFNLYFEKDQIAEHEKWKLEDKIFGINGLADTDNNGLVDVSEAISAYRKMGIECVVQPREKPSKEQLENYIKSNN